MSVEHALACDAAVQASLEFLDALLSDVHPRSFEVRLWDGTVLPASAAQPTLFTLVIQHPGALRQMFSAATERGLGEAYAYNDCDIEGDIESAVRLGRQLMRSRTLRERWKLHALLRHLPEDGLARVRNMPRIQGAIHSKNRDCRAVRYHYDVSNDFYSLFLDSRMIYSAAYFAHEQDDLETAQLHKLERICSALRLQPGERFLDVGCGWGGLITFAAQNCGARALGITLSEEQARVAAARILEAGVRDRCEVKVCDYRDLNEAPKFDKIASVGMIEHVGAKQLPEYFRRIGRLLVPGGIFLNSGVARPSSEPAHRTNSFSDAYIFPDGELEPIHEVIRAAELSGFNLLSSEDMSEHYLLTLRHWVRRLEESAAEARRIAGDVKYRLWRLYLAGSAERFAEGKLHVYQSVLSKPLA